MCAVINWLYADAHAATIYDMPVWMVEYYLTHCI